MCTTTAGIADATVVVVPSFVCFACACVTLHGTDMQTPLCKPLEHCAFCIVQEFEETQITVSVFDADTFSANDLIGSYQFDLAFVHSQDGVCFFLALGWHSIRFARAQGIATPETGLSERVEAHVCQLGVPTL